MCDSCYVHFMASEACWDLSDFERHTPSVTDTPEKRAFITLLDECNDKVREQQWHWHQGRQSQEEYITKRTSIRENYKPLLAVDPFNLALPGTTNNG